MLKVVRRDNYICQVCSCHVLDNEIEIDHLIPHSKGGPTTVDNLRLLCRDCNRKKSDSLAEILDT
jgi:5-methylcytosine-specific restriction endonuclease McrA